MLCGDELLSGMVACTTVLALIVSSKYFAFSLFSLKLANQPFSFDKNPCFSTTAGNFVLLLSSYLQNTDLY